MNLYVSPGGDDGHPGTIDAPFATLGRARDTVRSYLEEGLSEDVVVHLREGVYRLDRPFVLSPGDGGTAEHSVTYAAYPGETAILSGGRPVTGWKAGSNGMWSAQLPDVKAGRWFFRQLFADGKRLPRGRFPETGFLTLEGHSEDYRELRFSDGLPSTDLGGGDTELVVAQNWSIAREVIASSCPSSLTARTPVGWVGHGACLPKPGMSVFLEHARPFVTRPGQWYLDRAEGVLHYRAAEGEDPNRRAFAAPVAEQLLRVEGPVRNIVFRGIRFEHAAFPMPEIGYAGIQACYYGTRTDEPATYAVPVAIEWRYARGCRMEACTVAHLGGSGFGLGPGCRSNTIAGCTFTDVGGTGINLGHMPVKDPLWADWSDPAEVPVANTVSNCVISHCGVELWGAHGIFDAMTRGTRIAHNELRNLPYGGIATGFSWGTEPTSQRDCTIAHNHVHGVMERLYDSGAIYTLGYQPGSVIRDNLLHGVKRSGYAFGEAANNGIFFDEGSKGFTVDGNVIYDTSGKPIRFNQSQEGWQTWTNNSFGVAPDEEGYPTETAVRAGPT